MADDDQSTSGAVPNLVQEFINQFRVTTERLEDFGRLAGHLPSAPGPLGLPGAFSAAQMNSIADGITAQRHSIDALKAQLSSFDQQLVALQQLLGPLQEWSKTWADLEQRLLNQPPRPQAGT